MKSRLFLLIAGAGLLTACTAYVPGPVSGSVAYGSGAYYDNYGAVSRPVYVEPRAVIAAPVYPPVVRVPMPGIIEHHHPGHFGHHEYFERRDFGGHGFHGHEHGHGRRRG